MAFQADWASDNEPVGTIFLGSLEKSYLDMVLYSLQESKLQAAEAVKSEILFDFFIFPFFLKKKNIYFWSHCKPIGI